MRVIARPRETAAQNPAVNGTPLQDGPLPAKAVLLKSITERCTARLKSRPLTAAYAGQNCGADAELAHSASLCRDPEAETKAIAWDLLPLKFDISREAYGTEDTYVVIKSGEPLLFFALHGLVNAGAENAGMATLAMRVPTDLLPEMITELKADPRFINELFHAVFPSASELSFSIKSRIDIIHDRSYSVSTLGTG